MCKKQTVVSHSSSESEIVALDTNVRTSGIPAVDFWDTILNVYAPHLPDVLVHQRIGYLRDKELGPNNNPEQMRHIGGPAKGTVAAISDDAGYYCADGTAQDQVDEDGLLDDLEPN